MTRIKSIRNRQGKKSKIRRFVSIVFNTFIIYISLLGIFAFSGVSYLSDATFIFATFPIISIFILGIFVYSIYRYYPKYKILRNFIVILSILSLVIAFSRTIHFATTEGIEKEEIKYSKLMPSDKQKELIGKEGQLMAGAAKGDITPTKELFPMPLLSILKFRDINDSVHNRVLAMSDGKEQYLYITLDMTLVPESEKTLNFISKETGIDKNNILITSTHTHGVTPISLMDYKNPLDKMKVEKWYGQVKNSLIKTIAKAQSNMVPAKYGYGEGKSNVNINRDILDEDGEKSILGRNYEGYSDKTLRMVKIDDMNDNNIALIANHATHGVVMNGAINGPSTSLTGDLPGRSATKVEEKLNGGIVFWSSSAAGDQNPKIGAQGVLVDENKKHSNFMLGKKASSVVLEHLSDEHSNDIYNYSKKIKVNNKDSLIQTKSKTVKVEADKGYKNRQFKLKVFKLGNIAFEGVSAEVVSSIGSKIIALSPYENTILMTMMNGYNGYIADEWQYDHDAFENSSHLKRGAGEKALIKGFSDIFNQIS
ncbi:neutral/alkaline non-lysosomal ceramidase N-terminal domain-containing protein [Mammaliicoccus sciuri]|uniref:neutral/alkaline non-lysosomal ceramidase N-terminal domain-containing protein n=1 Tax=Mammaliicoccus sciuri TaxID=1296 RepID=UPI000E67D090|nr:neutral/alkaline non-lysosomal ceramidase N-terminal domain-containing protein [Mammaliicoccus sciuri]MBO3080988.1 neutral/alkaline non-lysosomal ceramidase N-terminal domain-containing protein [Mammaliicoccus sciuri]MEB6232754.1 neutral/alkaline non-lysosomal ceramidase N-terminal domain-containing protein [Mammaliicoccus sciuri]RIN95174.1 hypothetical protein BU000_13155 [Mammaliicoccus sciuri]